MLKNDTLKNGTSRIGLYGNALPPPQDQDWTRKILWHKDQPHWSQQYVDTAIFILVGTFSLHEHEVYVCEHDVSTVIASFLTG